MDTNKTIYHICNLNTPEPEGFDAWQNIDSEDNLLALDRDVEKDKQRIFLINVHLNWGRPYASDYGFEVARKIRVEMQSMAPIIFYSPIPVNYFERESEVKKYRLLYGCGSGFIEAPFTRAKLDEWIDGDKRIPSLSRAALRDAQIMLCDLKGLILEELDHGLEFGRDPQTCLNRVRELLEPTQRSLISFETYEGELQSTYNTDAARFNKAKVGLTTECREQIVGSETTPGNDPDQTGYTILILEDDKRWSEAMKALLGSRFNVVETGNAEDAIQHLRDDTQNEIIGVICDWRLKQQNSLYWQKYQGYDVLQIALETGTRALFALTSVEDHLVHSIRNEMDLQFHLVKKQSLKTEGQKALFSDVLFEHCHNTVSNKFVSHCKQWNEVYKPLYMRLKSTNQWKDFHMRVEGIAEFVLQKLYSDPTRKIALSEELGLSITTKGSPNLDSIFAIRLIWFGLWFRDLYQEDMENAAINRHLRNIYLRTTNANKTSAKKNEPTKNYGNQMSNLGFVKRDLVIDSHSGLPNLLPHELKWLTAKGLLPRFPRNVYEVPVLPIQHQLSAEEEAERERLQKMMLGCAKYDEVKEKMGQTGWDRYQSLINKKSRFDEQQKRDAELLTLKEGLSNLRS